MLECFRLRAAARKLYYEAVVLVIVVAAAACIDSNGAGESEGSRVKSCPTRVLGACEHAGAANSAELHLS